MSERPLMTSLIKATRVMDLLVEHARFEQGLTLSAVAQQMQLPINSVHSILRTLCACGYASQIKRGVYGVGPKLLGHVPEPELDEQMLRPRVIQILKQCAKEQQEAYVCSVLRHGERLIFASVQSEQIINIDQTILDDVPFYSKVSCRVLTAFCTPTQRQRLITRQGLPGSEWPEADSEEKFQTTLKRIRQQGFLLMHEPALEVVTIACPLFTGQGMFWGTIGSYAPVYRMRPKRQKQWLAHLCEVCHKNVIA
ncbi:MAG: IclR family transcriptional regulator [Phycisphaeraceae bacterium JB051]